jgi:tetratricopeptide (TPR) repeat protein
MSDRKKKHDKGLGMQSSFFEKVETFYQNHQQPVYIIGGGVIVVVLAAVAFFFLYLPSQEAKANLAVIRAERYFGVDSLHWAVNGDGVHEGLKDIVEEYGMTKTGNRAKYMLGICYLRLGQFDDAIELLKKFKSDDKLVSIQALGSIGDAYMEKNDLTNAESYYRQAVSKNPNDVITPVYLLRLGMLYEIQSKWEQAEKMYTTLKTKHPTTIEAQDIDKRIAFVKGKK